MQVCINPQSLKGNIQAPASKSAMQRACAAALLHNGISNIYNPGISNDDKVALSIIQQLGAIVKSEKEYLSIESQGLQTIQQSKKTTIDCGESGLSVRMFSPICALSSAQITINGHGSLKQRPLHFFDEVLPQLGVEVQSNNGLLPVKIKGPMQAQNITVDGSASSQYITGLLMAYSLIADAGTIIQIDNLKSKPYVDLTLSIMQHFELPVPKHKNYQTFEFDAPIANKSKTIDYHVEGDWSNAAFWLVAGVINNEIHILGLDLNSAQADRAITQVLADCGADLSIKNERIIIRPSTINAFLFDATHCPDLFPPLVVLAAFAKGISRIKGLSRLIHKESNRAQTLQSEFGKLGVQISFENDEMIIEGGKPLHGAHCTSHNDHRIAMALSIAANKALGQTIIEQAEAINKSYPSFYTDFIKLGGDLNFEH